MDMNVSWNKDELSSEPCWSATVRLNFSHHNVGAKDEQGVRESIKTTFYEEYNLILEDYEIMDIRQDDVRI